MISSVSQTHTPDLFSKPYSISAALLMVVPAHRKLANVPAIRFTYKEVKEEEEVRKHKGVY